MVWQAEVLELCLYPVDSQPVQDNSSRYRPTYRWRHRPDLQSSLALKKIPLMHPQIFTFMAAHFFHYHVNSFFPTISLTKDLTEPEDSTDGERFNGGSRCDRVNQSL